MLKKMKTIKTEKREQVAKEIGLTKEDNQIIEFLASKFRTNGILNIAIEGNIACGKTTFMSQIPSARKK